MPYAYNEQRKIPVWIDADGNEKTIYERAAWLTANGYTRKRPKPPVLRGFDHRYWEDPEYQEQHQAYYGFRGIEQKLAAKWAAIHHKVERRHREKYLILATSLRRRVAKLVGRSKVAWYPQRKAYTRVDFGNYLSFRAKDNVLTWCPKGKVQEFGNQGDWKRDGRQEGKPGRAIRNFLTADALARLTDKDIEQFVNLLKATEVDDEIRLVQGDDIRYWYDAARYAPRSGTLNHSCMRYAHTIEFLDLYCQNPDQIKMLIATNDKNQLTARALVWYDAHGDVYLDRVYGNDVMQRRLVEYGQEQGWYTRDYTRTYYQQGQWTDPDGHTVKKAVKIYPDKLVFDTYPYIDTMRFLNAKEHYLTCDQIDVHYGLSATNGRPYNIGYNPPKITNPKKKIEAFAGETEPDANADGPEPEPAVVCAYCEREAGEHARPIPGEDGVACLDCWTDRFFTCDRCNGVDRVTQEYCVHVGDGYEENWCENCYANHAFECLECGDTLANAFLHGYDESGYPVCNDCA